MFLPPLWTAESLTIVCFKQILKKLVFEFGCNHVVRYISASCEHNGLTPLSLSFSNSLQRRAAVNRVRTSKWLWDTKHLRVRWVVSVSIIRLSDFTQYERGFFFNFGSASGQPKIEYSSYYFLPEYIYLTFLGAKTYFSPTASTFYSLTACPWIFYYRTFPYFRLWS